MNLGLPKPKNGNRKGTKITPMPVINALLAGSNVFKPRVWQIIFAPFKVPRIIPCNMPFFEIFNKHLAVNGNNVKIAKKHRMATNNSALIKGRAILIIGNVKPHNIGTNNKMNKALI
jgi:hypothetical protein